MEVNIVLMLVITRRDWLWILSIVTRCVTLLFLIFQMFLCNIIEVPHYYIFPPFIVDPIPVLYFQFFITKLNALGYQMAINHLYSIDFTLHIWCLYVRDCLYESRFLGPVLSFFLGLLIFYNHFLQNPFFLRDRMRHLYIWNS